MQDISGSSSSSLLQFSLSCRLCKDPSVAPQNIFLVLFPGLGAEQDAAISPERRQRAQGLVSFSLSEVWTAERAQRGWQACVRPPLLLLPPVSELTHFKLVWRTTPSSEQTGRCTTQTRGKGAVWRDNGTGRRHPCVLASSLIVVRLLCQDSYRPICQDSFCTLLDLAF